MRSCKLTLCCYRRAASTVPTRWPSLARGRAKTLARNDLTMTTILDSREARSTARSPRHSAPSSRTATAIPLRSGSKRFTCFCRASTRRPLRCLVSSRTQRVLASARSLTTTGRRSSPILGTASAAGAAYFNVSDPYDEANHEPVRMSLADDLADIYRDVKNGLLAEQAVAAARPNDVLWTWRFDFESHWATHAADALRALQAALLVHYAEQLLETFGSRAAGAEPDSG